MTVYRSKKQDIKKSVVKTLLNIFHTVKTEWPNTCMSTKIKKMVVHSKPFIKIINILLLIARFVKSSDQTIYSDHKKK